MSRIKRTEMEVFQFDELSGEAKEKAREWWRIGDTYFAESVIEDAALAADYLGLNLHTRPVKLVGGGTCMEPAVNWSGFSCQGDGASFEGTWHAADMKEIREYAPKDTELHRIGDALKAIAKDYPEASARTTYSGRYPHSYCMSVDSESGLDRDSDNPSADADDAFPADDVTKLMRDFADWVYDQLEKEYNYQNSDEQIDETIRANEYEFTKDGHIA